MRIEKHKLIAFLFFLTFWICATVPFIIQEATRSYQQATVTMLWGVGELIIAFLGLWTLRSTVDKTILVIFCVITFVDSVVANNTTIFFWLNGCRMYFGLIFMFPIIRYFWSDRKLRAYFVSKMDRTIYLYLVIQFPCMVVQCVRYGAWDNVSGSIGWMASGTASTIIYLSSFYLMIRRWNRNLTYFENLKINWVLLVLLIPTWLNETKISFIYIAMYFFFLVPMDKNFIKRLIYIVPIIIGVVIGSAVLYSTFTQEDTKVDAAEISDYLIGNDILLDVVEYAFDNDVQDVNESDYARGLKFYILPYLYERHPGSAITGFGVGLYKGGTKLDKSEFSKRYFWLLNGTIMQWHMCLLEMGIPGGILYILFWITAFRLWRRHKGERNMRMSWMFGLVTIIFSVYIPPFVIPPFYMQFMFMVFTCSRWHELPAYRHVPLLGSKKFKFSLHD